MKKKNFLKYTNKAKELLHSIKDPLEEKIRSEQALLLSFFIKKACKSINIKKVKKFYKILQHTNTTNFLLQSSDALFRFKEKKKFLFYFFKISKSLKNFPIALKIKIFLFNIFNKKISFIFLALIKRCIKKILSPLAIFEDKKLIKFLKLSNKKISLFPIKQEALGKKEVEKNVEKYLKYISHPKVKSLHINISSLIYTQKFDIAYVDAYRALKKIFETAQEKSTEIVFKMESYKYFQITFKLFKEIIEEFTNIKAAIFLQSYIPQSFIMQKELLELSKKRILENKSPIKIFIVKGGYFSCEQIESSKKNCPQATFLNKISTDANFKKMVAFSLKEENKKIVKTVICTHNIFDLAYCLILIKESGNNKNVSFQMLKNAAYNIEKIIKTIFPNTSSLIVQSENFIDSLEFIFQRIEENIRPDNFLTYFLKFHKTSIWEKLKSTFLKSIQKMENLSHTPRKEEKKKKLPLSFGFYSHFENEMREEFFYQKQVENTNFLPVEISLFEKEEKNFIKNNILIGSYYLANKNEIDKIINRAKTFQNTWQNIFFEKKIEILSNIAKSILDKKEKLIKILMLESQSCLDYNEEILRAVDAIKYHILRASKLFKTKDINPHAKGVVFISSSKNFFASFIENIAISLLFGNCTIFSPCLKNIIFSFEIINIFLENNIPKEALQIVFTKNIENILSQNIDIAILEDTLENIKKYKQKYLQTNILGFFKERPVIIITNTSDQKLAIKHIFSFFNDKKSSIFTFPIILVEKRILDQKKFKNDLIDAITSLDSFVNIKVDKDNFLKLERKESWLLKPKIEKDSTLSCLGIKISALENILKLEKNKNFSYFINIIKVKNFENALNIFNKIKPNPSLSLQSLFSKDWKIKTKAKSIYINKQNINHMVKRSPYLNNFEAFKKGGPNFINNFFRLNQIDLPKEKKPINKKVNNLTNFIQKLDLSAEKLGLWYASIANYAFWWHKLKIFRDATKIIGQDNLFGYRQLNYVLRITKKTDPLKAFMVLAATLTCQSPLEISYDNQEVNNFDWQSLHHFFKLKNESSNTFIKRVLEEKIKRIRLLEKPVKNFIELKKFTFINDRPVLANGRYELLNYLQEIVICKDYYRYKTLGIRENELRKPAF